MAAEDEGRPDQSLAGPKAVPRNNRGEVEESTPVSPAGSGGDAEREQAQAPPLDSRTDGGHVRAATLVRALQERQARFERSAAGRYWSQLSAADFMNSSFAFAALAVL